MGYESRLDESVKEFVASIVRAISETRETHSVPEELPVIRPFRQNSLNPAESESYGSQFTVGWAARYNTIQTPAYRKG